MTGIDAGRLDAGPLRSAGKELLSLALIEARNHTLRWAAALETADEGRALVLGEDLPSAVVAELDGLPRPRPPREDGRAEAA